MRGKDGETDARLGQHLQCFHIHGGFRQPHPLGETPEPMLEIPDAPPHLRLFVAQAGQGHDDMVIHLGKSRPMPGAPGGTLPVGRLDRPIGFGGIFFHPQEQRRPEIEADPGIVADDPLDAAFAVQVPCGCVWGIALGGDPFIPVMIGIGRILDFNGFQPGVFAGRLVEVAVYAKESIHKVLLSADAKGERDVYPLAHLRR